MQVQDINNDQGRLSLSLRPSDLKLTNQMDQEEVLPLVISNTCGYLKDRDNVLAGASSSKGEIPGGRSLADLVQVFQPGGCVSGHVTSLSGDSAIIELEGGAIAKAKIGT